MLEDLRKIFEDYTKKQLPDLTMDSLIAADLGLNSFELFDIICEVEDKYGIEIPDRVLMQIITVKDLVEYIESEVQ